jgi:UDP-glucose 4-epimerase
MKIIITGEKGYIASNLFSYLKEIGGDVTCVSFREGADKIELEGVDAVVHCAAIVHKKEKDYADMYDKVNHIEAVKLAKKAKDSGVKHFVFMSSMSVYGKKSGCIDSSTECKPITLYGKSKLAAETEMLQLGDDCFTVTAVRPPMVYGKACPGNFATLKRFAAKSPVFPKVNNKRSMIYVENLTYAIGKIISEKISGVVLPMDSEYVNTSAMVKKIAEESGKKIHLSRLMGLVAEGLHFGVFEKVFGSLYYENETAMPCDKFTLGEAIKKSV